MEASDFLNSLTGARRSKDNLWTVIPEEKELVHHLHRFSLDDILQHDQHNDHCNVSYITIGDTQYVAKRNLSSERCVDDIYHQALVAEAVKDIEGFSKVFGFVSMYDFDFCLEHRRGLVDYIVCEDVGDRTVFSEMGKLSPHRFVTILRNVIRNLREAFFHCKFTHYDLHCKNVHLQNGKPLFIDYGMSFIEYNEKPYGPNNLNDFGGSATEPFPMHDIFRFVCSCAYYAYFDNKGVFKICKILLKFFTNAKWYDLRSRVSDIGNSFSLPRLERFLSLSHSDFLDWMNEQLEPIDTPEQKAVFDLIYSFSEDNEFTWLIEALRLSKKYTNTHLASLIEQEKERFDNYRKKATRSNQLNYLCEKFGFPLKVNRATFIQGHYIELTDEEYWKLVDTKDGLGYSARDWPQTKDFAELYKALK